MLAYFSSSTHWAGDVTRQRRLNGRSWWLAYIVCLAVSLAVTAVAVGSVNLAPDPAHPQEFTFALVVVLMGIAVCLARPVWGVYITVFLAILGDAEVTPNYPFTKNLSSAESILYLGDGLTFTPLELFLCTLLLAWVLRMLGTRQWKLYAGNLTRPMATFAGFVFIGLAYGLAKGGNTQVAIWEVRPIIYLALLYLIVVNLFEQPHQFRRLYWLVLIALTINSVFAVEYYLGLAPGFRSELESLGEHGASLQANALVILLLASWMFRDRSWSTRWILPFMAIPLTWAYLLSQRRAAMIALFGGIFLIGVVLRWRNRRVFWLVAPPVIVLGLGYTAAFWNSEGSAGFGAQAVKTVVAADEQSVEDQQSDLYRKIENYDIVYTIKQNPVTGVGFGNKFYRPYPLPDISFFVFWEYITHNSILWLWMQAGIGGFLGMLYLFAKAIRTGARTLVHAPDGATAAMTMTSVAYVAMFAVFAYVDIAWDTRNLVVLAIALAQIDRIAPRAVRAPGEHKLLFARRPLALAR